MVLSFDRILYLFSELVYYSFMSYISFLYYSFSRWIKWLREKELVATSQ